MQLNPLLDSHTIINVLTSSLRSWAAGQWLVGAAELGGGGELLMLRSTAPST